MNQPILGITGGIGSGKSTVCEVFKTLGIAVFNADDEAKKLYDTRPDLIEDLRTQFGSIIFNDKGQLDKVKLAGLVFSDPQALDLLNRMVHPRVAERFKDWAHLQSSPYLIREAAILIESGSYKDCHRVAVVTADKNIRIERVVKRNGWSRAEVESRINAQWSDDERIKYAHFVLQNDNSDLIVPQIMNIHRTMLMA